eukprot:4154130-Amphidinium_carterae.1
MDANKVLRGRTCPDWVQWVRTVFLDEGRFQRVEVGTELADRMDDGMLEVWERALMTPATFIDGSMWTQAYRRRWWLCSWPLKRDEHLEIAEVDGQMRCQGSQFWLPCEAWLRERSHLTVPTLAMPTLTRGIRRQRRPHTEQKGTQAMIDRWAADEFRPFVAEEREQLQGLELDYTAGACTGAEKQNAQK